MPTLPTSEARRPGSPGLPPDPVSAPVRGKPPLRGATLPTLPTLEARRPGSPGCPPDPAAGRVRGKPPLRGATLPTLPTLASRCVPSLPALSAPVRVLCEGASAALPPPAPRAPWGDPPAWGGLVTAGVAQAGVTGRRTGGPVLGAGTSSRSCCRPWSSCSSILLSPSRSWAIRSGLGRPPVPGRPLPSPVFLSPGLPSLGLPTARRRLSPRLRAFLTPWGALPPEGSCLPESALAVGAAFSSPASLPVQGSRPVRGLLPPEDARWGRSASSLRGPSRRGAPLSRGRPVAPVGGRLGVRGFPHSSWVAGPGGLSSPRYSTPQQYAY
jgi:hypothetical protein